MLTTPRSCRNSLKEGFMPIIKWKRDSMEKTITTNIGLNILTNSKLNIQIKHNTSKDTICPQPRKKEKKRKNTN